MAITLNGTTGITLPDAGSTLSTAGGTVTGQLIVEGSNGAVTVKGASTGAQLKLERTTTNAGHGYLGADADYALRVYNSSFADGLRVDQSGRVTMPYQPAFLALKGSNQTPNTTATTKITYDSTELNIGGAYNTSTSTFTAPIAGNYLFIVLFNPYNISNAQYNVILYKNGSPTRNLTRGIMSSDSDLCLPSSVILNLSANDYVEVYAQINDTSWGISSGSYWNSFSGYLLG